MENSSLRQDNKLRKSYYFYTETLVSGHKCFIDYNGRRISTSGRYSNNRNMHTIQNRAGPAGEAYSAPSDPLRGLLLGEGREGKGRVGGEGKGGSEGKGRVGGEEEERT